MPDQSSGGTSSGCPPLLLTPPGTHVSLDHMSGMQQSSPLTDPLGGDLSGESISSRNSSSRSKAGNSFSRAVALAIFRLGFPLPILAQPSLEGLVVVDVRVDLGGGRLCAFTCLDHPGDSSVPGYFELSRTSEAYRNILVQSGEYSHVMEVWKGEWDACKGSAAAEEDLIERTLASVGIMAPPAN